MITRKIINIVTYRDEPIGDIMLADSEYSKKIYILGIKVLDHTFTEIQKNYTNSKSAKPVGFNKTNKEN